MRLSGLRNYVAGCGGPDWTASGSASVLDLPGLTNITGAVCNFHTIQATEGGQVLATNLASITKAPLTILADGAASLVDLRGLRQCAGQGGYFITFEARNGGTVSVPQL